MLRWAFKEWAVICEALARGDQAIILRKGGIADSGDLFQPEHSRFWLYPTYLHQQPESLKAGLQPMLAAALERAPAPGTIVFTHFAEISGVYQVNDAAAATLLDPYHGWSASAVLKKFEYRTPGFYVLPVRIYRIPAPIALPVLPAYDGCKTWVELERELPTEGAIPVIDEREYTGIVHRLEDLLNPTMLA